MEETAAPPARSRRTLGVVAIVLVVVLVAIALSVIAFRDRVALAVVQNVARGFGYQLDAGTFDVTFTHVRASNVRVRDRRGEPVLDARVLDIGFAPRDLLPGGRRLFGLESVDLRDFHITLVHHADGSYNITLPPASASSAPTHPPPLNVALHLSGGSVDLIDRFVVAPRVRRERLVAVQLAGAISPASGAAYHGSAVLEDGSGRYPIRGNARFDDPRGFELQHWSAARLPIAGLANFALSSHAIQMQGGEVRSLDVTVGGLETPAGDLQLHLGARGRLVGVRIASTALAKPLRDAHGSFVIDNDAATIGSLDATVGGLALRVRGSLYDFSQPQIRFAVTVRGDLAQARSLSRDTARLPLSGAVALDALAEGAASSPLVFARVVSNGASYATYRLDGARGFVAVNGNELDLLAASAHYGKLRVAGRGSLRLARHTQTMAVATLDAPANALPYVDRIVPGLPLSAIAVVGGADARLAVRGYLGGTSRTDRLDVPFALASSGSGDIGPIVLQRDDGASVYARAALDGPAKRSVAIVDVRGLSLLPAPAVALPGFPLAPLPRDLDAKLDATLTGTASGTTVTSAGGSLHAWGSWGDLRADADGSAERLAARGWLRTSFARLAPFTGNIGARGAIDVPFAVTNAGPSTVVQIADARFPAASIRGIALQGADATLGIDGARVEVYAAELRLADGQVTASGQLGAGGRLHVTAGDVQLNALRSAGFPLAGGRATLIADLGGSPAHPTAQVVAALGGARYANTDVGGDLSVGYDGTALRIDRATVTYGGASVDATGRVTGLTPAHIAPHYDVRARVEDADIASLARTVKNPLRYPEGTLDADVRIGGSGAAPAVTGDIAIPEGSLNGLSFRSGRVGLSANPSAVLAQGGQVTVGSTTLDFGARLSRRQQRLTLHSPRVDLSDFNDYFDEAEVLAGTGHVALAVSAAPSAVSASLNLALRDARYRRFEVGSVDAVVATRGRNVRLDAGISGANGQARVSGTIALAASDPLRDIVRRSDLDLHGQIAGLDLGHVLPAAGLNLPVIGIVDADAVVRGHYPALALSTHAAITKGVVGRVPIERFTLAATAANGRGRLTTVSLVAPGLNASAAGTFGVRPQDALDLRGQLRSDDLDQLITSATGKNPGVRGTLATTVALTGSLLQPQLAGTFDAAGLARGQVTIPAVHAEFAATRRTVDVRNGALTLERGGSIGFDGHVPLGDAAMATPLAFDFAPHHVDVGSYSPLLPDGSVVAGIFDGNVGLRGTASAPRLSGDLRLSGGSYRSKLLTGALTAIELDLNFAGTSVNVAKLHVHAAPGNIDGSGRLALRDLRDPIRGLSAAVDLTLAHARIVAPAYYVGTIDGPISLRKDAGKPATVGGALTMSSARIPYTALLSGGGTSSGPAPSLPDVAFDLGVTLGRDVRVQSGPVDIGATGLATLGGTLAKPTLSGQFSSTDGTVSLYRTFNVQNGSTVSFNPADGVTPSVDATATTTVPDPPTDVLLQITGLATHLQLAFSSQPAYSQQQILGLLIGVQALGAVSGVAQSNGTSNGVSVAGLGEGVLDTQLTQRFLQPFTSKIGGALGLSDLNVNYNTAGGVSTTAIRRLGKNVSFTYGEQIGGANPRTSLGIRIGNTITSAQLTFYQTEGADAFGALTPFSVSNSLSNSPTNFTLESLEPPTGSGFIFSYQRHFW